MDLIGDLTRIGFTEYEAKVYLALLSENPTTGYQVSKRSGVPRSMTYDALGRLRSRGAILESIEDRASYYRPVPPDILLDRHEQDHRHLVTTLRTGLRDLYSAPAEDRVWSLSGRSAALTYAAQLIRGARSELFLVLTDDDLGALYPDIAAAAGRGVPLKTLLTGTRDLDCGEVAHHPPAESEVQGLTTALIVVVDNGEALIAGGDTAAAATITRNNNTVQIARQFVWMEFFTQRIAARLGPDLLARLDPDDRRMLESHDIHMEHNHGSRR